MPRLGRNALPAIMLFVIILWALIAVFMLTRILASAVEIDDKVGYITTQTTPIDRETDGVRLAGETVVISTQILDRAVPLSPMFAEIVKSGDGIEASAVAINDSAQKINASVKTINGSARSINGIVVGINSQLESVHANAASINTSVHQILRSFDGILGEVITIEARLDRASAEQADPVLGLVRGIKGDTATIIGLVDDINRNASSINNAPILLKPCALLPLLGLAEAGDDCPPGPGTAGVPAAGPVPPLALPLLPGIQLPQLGLGVPGSLPLPLLLPGAGSLPLPSSGVPAPAAPGPLLQLPGAGPAPLLPGVGGPLR